MSELKSAKFIGYGDETPFFGDGSFTVGKTYPIVRGPEYYWSAHPHPDPDALFIDDNGEHYWEDLKYFCVPEDILKVRLPHDE